MSSLSFGSFEDCKGSKHWSKLFAINVIFTSPFIHTDINTPKETFQQEPFIPFPSGSRSSPSHASIVISKHTLEQHSPPPNSLVVHSVNPKQSGIPRTWTLRQSLILPGSDSLPEFVLHDFNQMEAETTFCTEDEDRAAASENSIAGQKSLTLTKQPCCC